MGSRFIARRIVQAVVTIVFIVLLNFILFRAMPGSPERILARNPNVTQRAIEQTRERWGLNKPLFPDQFVAYIGATARADFGFSLVERGRPVTEVIGSRLGADAHPVRGGGGRSRSSLASGSGRTRAGAAAGRSTTSAMGRR